MAWKILGKQSFNNLNCWREHFNSIRKFFSSSRLAQYFVRSQYLIFSLTRSLMMTTVLPCNPLFYYFLPLNVQKVKRSWNWPPARWVMATTASFSVPFQIFSFSLFFPNLVSLPPRPPPSPTGDDRNEWYFVRPDH